MTNSRQKLKDQIKAVNNFTKLNGLQLNLQKCEILTTGRNDAPDTVDVDGAVIPVNSTAKTLGTWLAHDLSSKKRIA